MLSLIFKWFISDPQFKKFVNEPPVSRDWELASLEKILKNPPTALLIKPQLEKLLLQPQYRTFTRYH